MPIYTLTITGTDDGHQHTTVVDFSDDASVIADTRAVLDQEHASLAIARGRGDEVEFMGVWDWCEGQPRWTPDE